MQTTAGVLTKGPIVFASQGGKKVIIEGDLITTLIYDFEIINYYVEKVFYPEIVIFI